MFNLIDATEPYVIRWSSAIGPISAIKWKENETQRHTKSRSGQKPQKGMFKNIMEDTIV